MSSQVTHPIQLPKKALKEVKGRKLRPMPLLDEGLVLAACDRAGVKRSVATLGDAVCNVDL